MNSLLTIIIPVYRVSNTMDRCIESIVSQKYDNMRIILVDDGSPDDCPEKCDRWAAKDNKITVIHKLHGGLSDARNAGLDIAGGDYITFVDSDDYIHPDTYYDVMHLISQHPEYDILEFPVYKFFGTSGQQLLTFSNKEYHDIADYWMTGQAYDHAYAWNKIYRRRLFDKVRFPVGRVFEDVYTLPQLLEHSKIVATTDKGLYYYCQNDNGITACAQGNELRMLLESHIKVINKYRKHPLFHHYYMHVVNIQICEYEKNGDKPLLRQERIKRLDGLNMKSKLKAITINSLGIKRLCILIRFINNIIKLH